MILIFRSLLAITSSTIFMQLGQKQCEKQCDQKMMCSCVGMVLPVNFLSCSMRILFWLMSFFSLYLMKSFLRMDYSYMQQLMMGIFCMRGLDSFLNILKEKGDNLYIRVIRFLILTWSMYMLLSSLESSVVLLIFSTQNMQISLNSAMKSMKLFLIMANILGARELSAARDFLISYNSLRIYSQWCGVALVTKGSALEYICFSSASLDWQMTMQSGEKMSRLSSMRSWMYSICLHCIRSRNSYFTFIPCSTASSYSLQRSQIASNYSRKRASYYLAQWASKEALNSLSIFQEYSSMQLYFDRWAMTSRLKTVLMISLLKHSLFRFLSDSFSASWRDSRQSTTLEFLIYLVALEPDWTRQNISLYMMRYFISPTKMPIFSETCYDLSFSGNSSSLSSPNPQSSVFPGTFSCEKYFSLNFQLSKNFRGKLASSPPSVNLWPVRSISLRLFSQWMQYLPHSFFQERERKAMGKEPDIWMDLQTGRCGVVLWLKKRSILSWRSTDVTVNYTPVIQQYYSRVSCLAQGISGFFRQLKSLSFALFLYDWSSFLDSSAIILSTPSQFFRPNHPFLSASFASFLAQFLSASRLRISSSALMPNSRDKAQTSTSSNAVPVIRPAQSSPLMLILFKFSTSSTKQLDPGMDLQQGYMPQQVRQLLQQQQQQLPQQFLIVSPSPNFQVSSKVSREAMVGLTALSRSTIFPCTEGYFRVSKMISVRLSCMKPKLCSIFLMASPWFLKQCASMQSSQVSLIFTYRSFSSQLVSSALGKSRSQTKLSIMQQTSIESYSVMPALMARDKMAPADEPITLVMGRGMFPKLSL